MNCMMANTQERIRNGVYTEIVNLRFNKETGEVERVQVRCLH